MGARWARVRRGPAQRVTTCRTEGGKSNPGAGRGPSEGRLGGWACREEWNPLRRVARGAQAGGGRRGPWR